LLNRARRRFSALTLCGFYEVILTSSLALPSEVAPPPNRLVGFPFYSPRCPNVVRPFWSLGNVSTTYVMAELSARDVGSLQVLPIWVQPLSAQGGGIVSVIFLPLLSFLSDDLPHFPPPLCPLSFFVWKEVKRLAG